MPTPSTRTPVRIARGSYSNLNGSVSDLHDGEISYAEDQNTLYIKEGTSLVSLTFAPASPTFTGDVTFTGAANNVVFDASDNALEFADNAKATFGAGSDLMIYHDQTDSFIDSNTGKLRVLSDQFRFNNAANDATFIHASVNGAVSLYHSNSAKLATSSTGATVTGTLVSDGLTVDTNTLHVDASSNRVGIKTTSPTEVLDLGQGSQINLKVGSRSFMGSGYSTNATILGHSVKSDTTNTVAGQMMVTETNSGGGAPSAIRQESGTIQFHTLGSGTANAVFSSERLRIEATGVSKFSGSIAQVATAMGALEVDCRTSNYFTKTISGNSTFTFANPAASGQATAFTLELTHSSGTVTWPSSVKWNADTAPALTAGKTHLFMFVTDDGGTRWRGSALVDYVN